MQALGWLRVYATNPVATYSRARLFLPVPFAWLPIRARPTRSAPHPYERRRELKTPLLRIVERRAGGVSFSFFPSDATLSRERFPVGTMPCRRGKSGLRRRAERKTPPYAHC